MAETTQTSTCPTLTCFVENANVAGWMASTCTSGHSTPPIIEALKYFGRLVEDLVREGTRPHLHDLIKLVPRECNELADSLTKLGSARRPQRWLHQEAHSARAADLIAVSDAGISDEL